MLEWFRRRTVRVSKKGPVDLTSLRRLVFEHQHIENAAYSDRSLDEFLAIASTFKHCRFERLSIRSACFGGGPDQSLYEACSFDGSKLECGAAGVAKFVG